MNPSNFPNPTPGSSQSPAGNVTGESAGQSSSTVAQSARDAATKIKSVAGDTAHRAMEQAETIASEKKQEAAARVDSYGNAVHESAKALEEQDPNLAWLTHRAADRLQGIANYVRERDFRTLRTDAEDFARRHPAAFFGGMCVAGFILGSALKASQRKESESGEADFSTSRATTGDYDPDLYGRAQETVADAPSAPAAMI